jgi:DnaD/phage-associated family protein
VERERQYIEGWVDMGFADDAIRLAYERTILQKGSMNWAYLNSILKNWHSAGLHTAEQAERGDRRPQNGMVGKNTAAQGTCQPSADRIRKSSDWLDEFLAGQKKEG